MDDYRDGLGALLPSIALDFFATFARFEFALKRGGFLKGQPGSAAEPNWDGFAGALGPAFFADMQVAPTARIFFEEPPMKLMVIGSDEIAFQPVGVLESAADLFVLVRRVRNNLFHGEKIYFGPRDEQLAAASLFVLDSAFERARQRDDLRRMTTAFAYAAINPH